MAQPTSTNDELVRAYREAFKAGAEVASKYEHLTDAANRIQVHINDAHHWQDYANQNYARGLRAALDAVLQGLS